MAIAFCYGNTGPMLVFKLKKSFFSEGGVFIPAGFEGA